MPTTKTATVLTDECGVHCGAQRMGDGGTAPLLIGHCKCEACDCPHRNRVVRKGGESDFGA